ncbi:MAG TPA: patatin-like phospholipase family protein [Pseudonocardia sp.]|nr:patatin-like phospholipase family protein [Pseudonocardia sp.]
MTQDRNVDLVLEGGGVRGIALLGAVLRLSDAGYRFPRVAGTSAGAIVAAFVAAYQRAGRDLHELEDVLRKAPLPELVDEPALQRATGPVGDGVALLLHNGMHDTDRLTAWVADELAAVGVRTFADLRLAPDPGGTLLSYQRYSLVVHTSDLTRRVLVRLPWDYDRYDLVADDQRVADAVCASAATPFFFRPVQQPTGRGMATWIDGGLLSNFPITVFDRTDDRPPRWPTWGIKLSGPPVPRPDDPVRTPLGVAVACLQTLVNDEANRYHLDDEGVNRRTVFVDADEIPALDFTLPAAQQDELFRRGVRAAERFLDRIRPARRGLA